MADTINDTIVEPSNEDDDESFMASIEVEGAKTFGVEGAKTFGVEGAKTFGVEGAEPLNNVTLAFFSNPMYLGMINRKKLNEQTDNKIDVKFYKKRLVSLFKNMIKGEEEPTKELKELYNKFVNNAIKYFEMTDKKDIIQNQHTVQLGDDKQGDDKLGDDMLGDDMLDENLTIEKANHHMMKKTINVANLKNYVITKHDNSSNEFRIIPYKIEIDLKTPELKIKGVKPKKIKEQDLSK
jgi:hypothetical protein